MGLIARWIPFLVLFIAAGGCWTERSGFCFSEDGRHIAWTEKNSLVLLPFLAEETHVFWGQTDSIVGRRSAKVDSVFMPIGPCAGASDAVNLQFSPDGRHLAYEYVSGVWVSDLFGTNVVKFKEPIGQIISYRWTGNAEITAVSWADKETRLIRFSLSQEAAQRILVMKGTTYVGQAAWSRNARYVVISESRGYSTVGPCRIVDTATGTVMTTLGDESWFESAAWTGDGRQLCILQKQTKGDPAHTTVTEASLLVYDLQARQQRHYVLGPPPDRPGWDIHGASWTGGDSQILLEQSSDNSPGPPECTLMDPNTGRIRNIDSELKALLRAEGDIYCRPLALKDYLVAAGVVNRKTAYAITADLKRAILLSNSDPWALSPDAAKIMENGSLGIRVRQREDQRGLAGIH